MTYATSSDITQELKGMTFSATTQVTSTAVSDFLDQADAVIDMHLVKRYAVPITGTKSLLIAKKIAVDIVVYRITKILDLTKSVPIPDSTIPQEITEGTVYKQSIKLLADIKSGVIDLPDETLLNSNGALDSFHSDSVNSDYVAFFNKGVDQW